MPRPKTKEIKWLLETFPKLQIRATTYIPLKEWIQAEMRAWNKEVNKHARRQRKRNVRLRGLGAALPSKDESDSVELSI